MILCSTTGCLEKQEAELSLLAELLRREQNRLAGVKTYSSQEMRDDVEALLHKD